MSGVRVRLGLLPLSPPQLQGEWRDTPGFEKQVMSPQFYAELARKAEASGIDFLLLADKQTVNDSDPRVLGRHANSWFEPISLMSYLASVTSKIGLVATASTAWFEPFVVARMFQSLDHLSAGRAGWNMVSSRPGMEQHNFAHLPALDSDARFRRHSEFIEVVTALWNSWDADAVIADAASSLWTRPGTVRRINHDGEFFAVEGPLNVQPAAAQHPLLVTAGASERFLEHAAANADVIFTRSASRSELLALTARIRASARNAGRPDGSVLVLPGATVEFSDDRRVCQGASAIDVHLRVWGSPREIAEQLVQLVVDSVADGVILIPRRLPEDLDRFAELVVPELRKLGAIGHHDEPRTLRERLGLPSLASPPLSEQ